MFSLEYEAAIDDNTVFLASYSKVYEERVYYI